MDIIPNYGQAVNYKGNEQGLHGEVSLIPWEYEILEDNPSKISIKFKTRTYRTPLYIEKILTLNSDNSKLYITEIIKNEGYSDIDIMWAQHPAIGSSFLDDSVIIDVPENKIKYIMNPENDDICVELEDKNINWQNFRGYSGKITDFSKAPTMDIPDLSIDQICLENLNDGWYAITNQNKNVGFGMKWDRKIFKYL